MPKTSNSSVTGEHIFPATELTALAIKWKQLYRIGRHKEAMAILEQIVVGSAAMFERLAQYEDFHYTVDLPVLVSAAQEKVIKWLIAWNPKKGKLFTWFSKCAKNAFRSELVKVNQYRKRYHVTSDNLEKFYGVEDHEVDKHDLASDLSGRLQAMTCRWADPQYVGAIRYLIQCITEDNHDKITAVRSASYAYGISPELAKFFYTWSLTNLRHTFHDKVYVPFTNVDLIRAIESFSLTPELIDIIGTEKFIECCTLLPGYKFKFPSLQQLAKYRETYNLSKEIENSDLDPDSVALIAKKHGRTVRSATEEWHDLIEKRDPRNYGEYDIFNEDMG